MNIAFSSFGLSSLFGSWRHPAAARPSARRETQPVLSGAEQARMIRALMHDRMGVHPEAVKNELSLMFLMTRFPIL